MVDASSLHCPNCGAPAAIGDRSCKYCHATLATVSCPKCFALMFEGLPYCPSCGEHSTIMRMSNEDHLTCVQCGGSMLKPQ
jgi:predicted RNA-binding Zn-ribbon protein involved in translation (DUF1610 family)